MGDEPKNMTGMAGWDDNQLDDWQNKWKEIVAWVEGMEQADLVALVFDMLDPSLLEIAYDQAHDGEDEQNEE